MAISDILKLTSALNRNVVRNTLKVSGLRHLVESAIVVDNAIIHGHICFDKRDLVFTISQANGVTILTNPSFTNTDYTKPSNSRQWTKHNLSDEIINTAIIAATVKLYRILNKKPWYPSKKCTKPKPCLIAFQRGYKRQTKLSKTQANLKHPRFTVAFANFIVTHYNDGLACNA